MSQNRKEKGNVPNLRFPEFEGEWKVCKLGDSCDMLMCKRIFAFQTSDKGDIPFYKIGTIGNTPNAYISKRLHDEYKKNYNYPLKGELLITCAGTVGKCIPFDGKDAYFQDSNIVWIDNPTSQISNSFLYHYISQVNWSKLNSTTITRIYNDDLRNLKVIFPSQEEQGKISTLLSLIEKRISTQTKIIEKYESLIKGIVDLLFKAKERNVQLKDCVTCHSSTLTESEVLEKKGIYPVYGAAGIITYFPDYNISEDSILIIKDGSNVGKLQYTFGKYSVIGTLNYLTVKGNNCLKYIYYCMRSLNFGNYKVGSGIPHIYFKDYGNELIYCPNFAEQEKIANALSMIDRKILIEKKLLENYVTQKKYLLQNLFI